MTLQGTAWNDWTYYGGCRHSVLRSLHFNEKCLQFRKAFFLVEMMGFYQELVFIYDEVAFLHLF